MTSSTFIGVSFPVNADFIFTREHSIFTRPESQSYFTMEEDVRKHCGSHSIVVHYVCTLVPFASYGSGQIRSAAGAASARTHYWQCDCSFAYN